VRTLRETAETSAGIFLLSAREAWRNRAGFLLMVAIPAIFLGAVELTAGEGYVPVKLFFLEETLQVILTVRHVCMVFGAAGVCGFLSAYYALILFHQDFDYFRFCAFSGMTRAGFLAGRFGFFLLVVTILAAATTLLASSLVHVNDPAAMFAGFVLLGLIYGAIGGIVGMVSRDFLVAFLCVAILADIDAAWLQNPVYYTAGQELGIIRWLPAFYPCQQIFAAAFTVDLNYLALMGSGAYGTVLLSILLGVIGLRLAGFRGRKRRHDTVDPLIKSIVEIEKERER